MKRNKFSLSHTKLLTCDMGELIPVGCIEVLPGDTFQHSTSCLVRFAPMLAPPMHPVHISLAHWFVPNRLIWSEWEDFITGGPAGTSLPVHPYKAPTLNVTVGSLADYLGVPVGSVTSTFLSALPFRVYQLIWNEWYRDQDLQTELVINTGSGADTTGFNTIQRANWSKDYFTSARPWEQKGPTVTVPLGTVAPLKAKGGFPRTQPVRLSADGTLVGATTGLKTGSDSLLENATTSADEYIDISTSFETDLSTASAVTVNVLRQALALQRFEEARARYGSRYTEYLRYLGVRPSDARLQRPEFLGGGRYPVQFSEVLTTDSAPTADPTGTLAGHGIGAARSNRYRRFFEEHGFIMSLMVVKPKAIYMNGVDRMWARQTKEDYFQRELQHIGQMPIYNGELFATAGPSTVRNTWGYQDRYDEYRSQWSSIHGEFRTTLDFWHFGRSFASQPALNSSFVTCTPSEKPFAVPASDNLQVMVKHSIQARRMVSKEGTSFIA